MNDGEFGKDLGEFARKTLDRADRLKRAVGIKLFSAVIKDTPVGDPDLWKSKPPKGYTGGRLRANWVCSLNQANASSLLSTAHAQAIPAMQVVVLSGDRKTTDFLSNNLAYARVIEYEGHSSQAPQGMVRRNVTRFQKLISGELRKLKS